jgi:branched-chain amino acid transport system ATP-binding protein
LAPDLITFDGVVAGYGALTILNELSFSVRQGEITLLIGPNGAGKSTVLKTLFGLAPPRAGAIRFKGRAVGGSTPAAMLRQGIAFVPQGRNLFASLSVRHNLELGAITLPPGQRKARFDEAIARFPHLQQRIDNQASTLSGGEQKQLEIARALQLRPDVILIDEPSIGLSPIVNQQVFALLRDLANGGATILMVEQNVRAALAVSDRVLLLESGRLMLDSPAGTLLDDPDLNRVFLGKTIAHGPGGAVR